MSRNLAWLDLDRDGAEYWVAMELMGKFASANHHVIHESIVRFLGHPVLHQVENHHNFAWRERHHGRDVVVHRKGATPAAPGMIGVIPGSMAAPGYLVEGLGNADSLNSTSHGAGRRLSRKAAIKTYTWKEAKAFLAEKGVDLISAGLDEVPWAYKNILEVMDAQRDLARPIATFMPRLVKMAPAGERPED
jgi:tRNA-splicing ligase RtcB